MPSKSCKTSTSSKFSCFLNVGLEDIAGIAQNKVLIAAGVSAAIGQLSKPFTSVLLYGKDFDFKAAFRAGGFPSTHSSAVVSTATCLALERGFSDSIFGLSVVYAGLVMYDSQGVRREVGNHAKVLNKQLSNTQVKSMASTGRDDMIDSQQGISSTLGENLSPLLSKEGRRPFVQKSTNAPLLVNSENKNRQASQVLVSSSIASDEEETEKPLNSSSLLKESIGHTEVEVIAGALLGFCVSLAVHTIV
ncbi:uncharacterized protein LOC110672311 [Hevea brasiliensis]|nr:uncharacterized protein LOC110672311 [Hevea brasiliensis]